MSSYPLHTPPSELQGNILTPEGWISGTLHFSRYITGISGTATDPEHNKDHYILPGFIDLHVHGGAGRDIMEGGDALSAIARMHAQHGTTSLLATTMTAPVADLELALQAINTVCQAQQKQDDAHRNMAHVLGVHLEGPYINPGKLGAQPDYAQCATLTEVQRLQAIAPIKLITVAPEMAGHSALIHALTRCGIRVQLGHTLGSYEDGVAALEQGASGFTHLFNAMTGLNHRAPGMVGAALAHASYAELIPDLIHVHPGAIRTALRAIPYLYCVTDSTAAAGMPDGEYMLGRAQVHKCLGGVRLADGTLAGSTLTMDQALRNLVGLGLELADASRRVSTYAANHLGLALRGRLQTHCFADMVVLDRNLQLISVIVEGHRITPDALTDSINSY